MFPLMLVSEELIGGNRNTDVEEYGIDDDVWIVLRRGILVRQYKVDACHNYVWFTDHGHLPCGVYDIEVYYDQHQGIPVPLRFKQEKVLIVVDSTEAGQVYESSDYDVMAYYPIINGRAAAVVIGDGYVGIRAGAGLNADIGNDSVNLRAGFGPSQVEITENNVNININE